MEKRMIQFGMPTLIENRTLEDNAALCSRLGLKFIELNMNFPEYQAERLEHTGTLLRVAEQAGIYYTIHLDENLNIADFNRLVTEAYLETVRKSIAAAKKLICLRDQYGDESQPLILNMHMNHGIYITLPDRKVQMYERDFDTYMKSFTLFRSLCEEWIGDSSLMVAIENTDGFREYEKKAIVYLLESPKFGLTWDIGHSKAAQEKDVPFILEHKEKLIHFHIHDGTERPPKNHLTLGKGGIDIKDRLKLAGCRNTRCVLETKTIEALTNSVRWLERNVYPVTKDDWGINKIGMYGDLSDRMRITLRRPSHQYAWQVMDFRDELTKNNDEFDGCAGLEDCASFEEWIRFEERLKARYKEGYVPSEVFLAVRETDDRLVGIIDYRHPLTDFLMNFGGNIGYSVRPSERRKGYASEMLRLMLDICCSYGEERVLLTCDSDNTASRKTILKNGGILENEIEDTVGLSKCGRIQRYWIPIGIDG